ncbi:beta-N-acetylhexosaminidase [Plantactinospora sp. WMMB782]|uniref:beta-N-acetylhexosaminidase n=1 Tax=Plantactinospora sp. WMMB782 TaxID=3404121 RepID=UPI003B945BEB
MAAGIIPRPESVTELPTAFRIDAGTVIGASAECRRTAELLAARLRASTGHPVPVVVGPAADSAAISLSTSPGLAESAYTVVVEESGVRLTGGDPAGAFHATQTFLQLCPPQVFRRVPLAGVDWTIGGIRVADRPRFGWRGMLVDVARHFFGRDAIFKLVDALALHHMNVLHLHLTDDQGWRVQIDRYPELTRVGSWRECSTADSQYIRPDGAEPVRDHAPHNGYFTKEDLREIVAYAADRFVTVVPEIDLPGHSQAAIAAHPELGNLSQPLDVWTDWGVSRHVLNVEESTMRFYEHVLDEVLEIFPGPFVHIGGDEVPTDEWRASAAAQARIRQLGLHDESELQGWVTDRFATFLEKRGRRAVGWDEILDHRIPVRTVVMSWRGTAGGIAAARAGHDVVMTPDNPTYLYHPQTEDRGEQPLAAEPPVTLRQVYGYDPIPPGLPPADRARILGAQCQMWTEFVVSERQMHQLVFPRFCAFAEAVWRTGPGDFDDFSDRLAGHAARLHALDIDGFERRPSPRPAGPTGSRPAP